MLPTTSRAATLPAVIQGGMGVGVSGWELARAVSLVGQLGVVSGTALDVVHARRLADGDPGGHLHRAYAAFPNQDTVERVLARWFVDGGRDPDTPYRPVPMFSLHPSRITRELTVLANFAEVWLAKEGHSGLVGINLLEKVQLPTPFAVLGAMLAGVDVVLMGAGIPAAVPALLDDLARGGPVTYRVDVAGASEQHSIELDPRALLPDGMPSVDRPAFLAIVGAHTLAAYLAKDPATRPDGFVVEGPTAGGHNAPPRGKMQLDHTGQPVYGERDAVDLDKMLAVGLPFWLAGGYGSPDGLRRALAAGASGIQVGTAFALCDESGMAGHLKAAAIEHALEGSLRITTDPLASPSGYPFKVASLDATLSDPEVYEARERVCDLGFLRVAYERDDGTVGFRCPSEPDEHFIAKGGADGDTDGRKCLCNGLMSTVDLPQVRRSGAEPPLVTLGDDTRSVVATLATSRPGWTAAQVVEQLVGRT
jgi:NAD(P)H-dependent flavin oxidoreductase YrpB (nitropropane dioxygenase family)